MSLYLYFSPFFLKFSGSVDEEGASFDSKHFPAIHIFFFDHLEQVADLFVGIREQVKREAEFISEFFVGSDCISRQSEHNRVSSLEFQMLRFEVTALVRAAGGIISRVEVKDDIFSTQRFQAHRFAPGRR